MENSSEFIPLLNNSEISTDTIEINSYIDVNDTPEPANPGDAIGRIYKLQGDDGLWYKPDSAGPAVDLTGGGGGGGDVLGPASAVNNNIAVFNTTTGKLIKDSLIQCINPAANSLIIGSAPAVTGVQNTGYGFATLSGTTNETGNTALGYNTRVNATFSNSISIGKNAVAGASNMCQIGDVNVNKLTLGNIGVIQKPNSTSILLAASSTAPVSGINNTLVSVDQNYSLTTGTGNTFVGKSAGLSNNSNNSTAVGFGALSTAVSSSNTAIGEGCMLALVGNNNTGVGTSCLGSATCSDTCAIGVLAGSSIGASANCVLIGKSATCSTASTNRIAIGSSANNNIGDNTVQLGSAAVTSGRLGTNDIIMKAPGAVTDNTIALYNGTTGNEIKSSTLSYSGTGVNINTVATGNTSFTGTNTPLSAITTGSHNTMVGNQAGNTGLLVGGSRNTGVGSSVFLNIDNASSNNTAMGVESLQNVIGSNNTAYGDNSAQTVEGGTSNTCLGRSADVSIAAAINRIAIGSSALCSADNSCQIGDSAVRTLKLGSTYVLNNNVGGISFGSNVNPYGHVSYTGIENIFMGAGSGGSGNITSGSQNTGLGFNALNFIATTGARNTGVGRHAGYSITSGIDNVLLGTNSDTSTPNAINRIAIGSSSSCTVDNSCQIGNTSVTKSKLGSVHLLSLEGTNSEYFGTTNTGSVDSLNCTVINKTGIASSSGANNSTLVGTFAGSAISTAIGTTAIGTQSLILCTTSPSNTALGSNALSAITIGAGNNTGLGNGAGNTIQTGAYNTCLGSNSDVDSITATNRIAIGNLAICTVDNTVQLGDSAVTSGKIGTKDIILKSGPATDNVVPRYNGTTGDIQNSSLVVSDTGAVTSNTDYLFSKVTSNIHAFNTNTPYGNGAFTGSSNGLYGRSVGGTNLLTTGQQNIVIGDDSFTAPTGGTSYNTIVGAEAGQVITGNANVCIGVFSGKATTTGVSNCFVGVSSGQTNVTSSQVTAIGRFSCATELACTGSTYVGYDTGGDFQYSTAIGYGANCTAANQLQIGATSGLGLLTSAKIGTKDIVTKTPGTVTDKAIARFDLTTGTLIQGSGVTIDDGNKILGAGGLTLISGGKISSDEGNPNSSLGTAALVAGTATINTTAIGASSRVFLTKLTATGTAGGFVVEDSTVRVNGTSFTIKAINATNAVETGDTSTVAWFIVDAY